MYSAPDHDSDVDELRWERFHQRQHQSRLMRHPDCRDPDHPGCDACWEDEDEEA